MHQMYPEVYERITLPQLLQASRPEARPLFQEYLDLTTNFRAAKVDVERDIQQVVAYVLSFYQLYSNTHRIVNVQNEYGRLKDAWDRITGRIAALRRMNEEGRNQRNAAVIACKEIVDQMHHEFSQLFIRAAGPENEQIILPGQVYEAMHKLRGIESHLTKEGAILNPVLSEHHYGVISTRKNLNVYQEAIKLLRQYGVTKMYWEQLPLNQFVVFFNDLARIMDLVDYDEVIADGGRISSGRYGEKVAELQEHLFKGPKFERTIVSDDYNLQSLSHNDVKMISAAMNKDYWLLGVMHQVLTTCSDIQCHWGYVRQKIQQKEAR